MLSYKKLDITQINNETILSFDIEVSSGWIFPPSTEVVPYSKERTDEEYNNAIKVSLCYIWQFSVNETVYYGRELSDFKKLLERIDDYCYRNKYEIFIYCHNLSYEFQTLRNIFTPNKVLALSSRSVISSSFLEIPTIQFRCSYMLTRLSLAKLSEQTTVKKLDGVKFDYHELRTPKTPLTAYQLNYAENDCLVVYETIKKFKEQYKTIKNIPYTQTGIVRRETKQKIRSNKKNLKHISKMQPRDYDEYKRWLMCFGGGDCHANILFIGLILKNIHSFDFASSYPYRIVAERFPNTPFFPCPFSLQRCNIETDAYLLHLKLTDVQAKTYNHSLSSSRCLKVDRARKDNGRIISAKSVELWCTELDFLTYYETYNFTYEVIESYKSNKSYLSKELIEEVLKQFANKTSLKGVDNELYMQAKQYINCIYGMMVTKAIFPTWEVGEEWNCKEPTAEELDAKFKKEYGKPNSKRFLSFIHGVYVTSYARRSLWELIIKYDKYVVYFDTDSLKTTKYIDFTEYNKTIEEKLKAVISFYNITDYVYNPKTPQGKEKMLGCMEYEGKYDFFRTQGAKRYMVYKNHKKEITVAGVSKLYSDSISIRDFEDGYIFDRDLELEKNMQLLTYIDNDEYNLCTWKKGEKDEYKNTKYTYGINMRNRGYTMGLTDEFLTLLENYKQITRKVF